MTAIRLISSSSVIAGICVLTGCGGGAALRNATQAQAQVTLTVSPKKATVPVGTTQPFMAFLEGITPTTAVQWRASAGTIDQSGNYTAPATLPAGETDIVTATSTGTPSASASATVTVTLAPVTISLSPLSTTLKAGFTQNYTAAVDGTTNTFVTWSANDLPGDPSFPGFMSGTLYTAPAPLLSTHSYSIVAASNADPTKIASSSVTVTPLENQELQTFPIKLGASGVNANAGDCCSGTLGSLLKDQKGKEYILSNNHILGRVGHAVTGEGIVQPGYVDTFCNFNLPNTVAHFTAAPSITTSNVDAAIAEVVPGAVDPQGEIIGLGGIAADGSYIAAPPAGATVSASIGMPVAKSGRTTGLSCGSVIGVEGSILIDIPAECGNPTGITVSFTGQVLMGSIVQHGDSGSLIVEAATSRPVALVAGLSNDGRISTGNPIGDVISALNASTGLQLSFVGAGQHSVSCSAVSNTGAESLLRQQAGVQPILAPSSEEIAQAITVKRKYEDALTRNPIVRGIAVGPGAVPEHAAILVFVETDRGRLDALPKILDGFEVRIVSSGRFRGVSGIYDAASSRCASSQPRLGMSGAPGPQ